jgi:myo-inositol-1(or 4)-monophosphatase
VALEVAVNEVSRLETLTRIEDALEAAVDAVRSFTPGAIVAEFKSGNDPVTEADRTANRILRSALVRDGEGWLSEESVDDFTRLEKERIWVVDPLDGTREFVAGIPEWCISVACVENGRAVAGGVCNPAAGVLFLGALGHGITLNGKTVRLSDRKSLAGAIVLASRNEVKRGEWVDFRQAPFVTRPIGSVAYKLALVAAGLADATWSLVPKNEWDIAGGTALIEAAGGFVRYPDNTPLVFNRRSTLLPGFLACGPWLLDGVSAVISSKVDVVS